MPKDQKHVSSARLYEINKCFINEWMNKWMISHSKVWQGKAGLHSYTHSYLIFHVRSFPCMYCRVCVPLCLEAFGLGKSGRKTKLSNVKLRLLAMPYWKITVMIFFNPMIYFTLLSIFISSSKQKNLNKPKEASRFFFPFCRKDSSSDILSLKIKCI